MNSAVNPTTSKYKVLLADDNETDRLILSRIIKKLGHEVIAAADGKEATELFDKERPHIVLLDALMPVMDGKEAARYIKKAAADDFVPVLFLTSLQDATELADCLDAGGDDFLSKPYNTIIFQAKLNALIRMRTMHATIYQNNQHMIREQTVAKEVFDNVAHHGSLDVPNIKHMLSPMALFNGDVLLVAQKPSGGMHVMLGDFTGHGLAAAIGAMPTADIFYGMTSKGFTASDIASEINIKLKAILPASVFCCACILDISFEKQLLRIWLGGLPDCFLYRNDTKTIDRITSDHLPLGIVDSTDFDTEMQLMEMSINDRLLVCSDGISEAMNSKGEMFGEEGIIRAIESCGDGEEIFSAVKDAVNVFIGNTEKDDDSTLVEVKMVEDSEFKHYQSEVIRAGLAGPRDWSMQYELGALTLREFNPLPLMLHIIMEVPGLRTYNGQIYTILAELFSNALEHGVLGLDSDLKSTPTGFIDYYEKRSTLLGQLSEGYVSFAFSHEPSNEGGKLSIQVEDSGAGFDFENQQKDNGSYCGRGMPLLRSLCSSVEYQGNGNTVEAVFLWERD